MEYGRLFEEIEDQHAARVEVEETSTSLTLDAGDSLDVRLRIGDAETLVYASRTGDLHEPPRTGYEWSGTVAYALKVTDAEDPSHFVISELRLLDLAKRHELAEPRVAVRTRQTVSVLTREGLAQLLAERAEITRAAARDEVRWLFETLSESLRRGDEVRIHGFATFKLAERAARTGATGQIARRTVVRFSPSSRLSASLTNVKSLRARRGAPR